MNLKFQFETSSLNNYGGVRKLPYVFTQEGVSMLASVLRTSIAAEVSVNIMRAFVTMKKYISNSLLEQRYINDMVLKDNKRIDLLEEAFSQFDAYKENSNEIYFEGQIYDAYSKITDIMKQAKKELIIVDAYADKNVLDMIKGLNCRVKIISRDNVCLKKLDIEKYNSQYNNLEIIYSDLFHDRYLIIDNRKIYHCGTSINHAGSRIFSINLLSDSVVINALLVKIRGL